MALTPAQRKKIERNRKRDSGLIPVEIWVHPEQKTKLKQIEEKCQKDKKYLP